MKGVPVTTYESTTVVVAGLQLFVSALGFVVVAWTLRVLVRSIDAQSSAGVAARQLEFDKVILAYPCLYKYFYQGHDIGADDPAYTRVMAATQLLANYFDGYFTATGDVSPDVARQDVEAIYTGSRRKEPCATSARGRQPYMVRFRVCSDVRVERRIAPTCITRRHADRHDFLASPGRPGSCRLVPSAVLGGWRPPLSSDPRAIPSPENGRYDTRSARRRSAVLRASNRTASKVARRCPYGAYPDLDPTARKAARTPSAAGLPHQAIA